MANKLENKVEIHSTIQAIGRENWKRVESPDFPFSDFEYLSALEASRSIGGESGWTPCYLTLSSQGRLEGATVLYLKAHSYGEYIFDWEWARAYQQHGMNYYPKLLAAIPFTPASGPKLLVSADSDRVEVEEQLVSSALALMDQLQSSSLHYLFLTQAELSLFERKGFGIRHTFQYHWENAGYSTFEDYLGKLKSRKRKQVLKERKDALSSDLVMEEISGERLGAGDAARFYPLYLSTIHKMGAVPYLTLSFFEEVFQTMRDRIVLWVARREDTWVAGALNFRKGNTLYGRYWGSLEEHNALHFELCYYRAIEFAILNGLQRVEAGAQGEHKLARGFLPRVTYSAHAIAHPEFRRAIFDFIAEERQAVQILTTQVAAESPFAKLDH